MATNANATNTTAVPLTYNNQFTGTLASSTSVTVPSGTCTPLTVGSPIYGTGIPQGDTVAGCSSTTLTLAITATRSGSETLTFRPATAVAPVTLTSNSSYPTCTAPCMISVAFANGNNDTSSSPFYDYGADTLYIGDNKGNLHQFNPVFKGTPKEVTSGWPVAVSSGASDPLTSPVYDSTSGKVFFADSDGFLYSYKGTTLTQTSQLAASGSKGIVDAPLVDSNSTSNNVYVFVGLDGNVNSQTNNVLCKVNTGCNGVFQIFHRLQRGYGPVFGDKRNELDFWDKLWLGVRFWCGKQ